MNRSTRFCWMMFVLSVGAVACSGTADEPADDESEIRAPNPGAGKQDSRTRRTEMRGAIDVNRNIEGEYRSDAYLGYTFEVTGEADVGVSVIGKRGETDPAVWLYGPRESDGDWGDDVAESHDVSYDNDDAKVAGVQLEEAGTYLVVTAPEAWSEGPYTLRVDCSGPGCEGVGGGSSDQCSGEMTVAHEVPVGQAGTFSHGSQSGKDLEVVAETAYMANMQKGICRFDVSQPSRAELLDCMAPPSGDGPSTHRVHDIEIAGNAMFVLNSLEGLWVYDLSDPTDPRVIGSFRDGEYFGLEMTLHGDYLYLAARQTGTHILDVSNPSAPTRAGYLADTGASSPADDSASFGTHMIAIDGEIGYFAQRQGGLGIYDLSDPTDPIEIGRYRPQKAPGAEHPPSVMAVSVEGETAFLAAANDTSNLHLLDVGRPDSPSLVWTDQAAPERRYWTKETLAVSDEFVALARGDDRGVEVFERSDDGTPSHLGTVEPDGSPEDLYLTENGSVLYAASANTLRNPRGHLMGLGVISATCE